DLRQEQHIRAATLFRFFEEMHADGAVGRQRQMRAVLLDRGNGQDNDRPSVDRIDFPRGQLFPLHRGCHHCPAITTPSARRRCLTLSTSPSTSSSAKSPSVRESTDASPTAPSRKVPSSGR